MKNCAFIFDDVCVAADRQIGEHSHSQWELSHVVCGSGIRTIGDCTEHFSSGEIVLIPPGIPHIWKFDGMITDSHGNISNLSVFFETSVIDGLINLLPEIAETLDMLRSQTEAVFYVGEDHEKISALLFSMRNMTAEARLHVILELLRVIALADSHYKVGRSGALSKVERKLEMVRVYCSCNYFRPISLDEIAAHVGMNKSAFCTFMRRHAGMTMSEYVNSVRLAKAKECLVNCDSNIAEIAFDCGFSNVTYFNRLFRSKYGCTPKSFRHRI